MDTDRRIRPGTIGDIDALVRLRRETFVDAYSAVHDPGDMDAYFEAHYSVEVTAEELACPRSSFLISFRSGVPVGFCLTKVHGGEAWFRGAAAELRQLYVRSTEYGTGLSAAMLGRALRRLSDRDIRWIWLTVSNENARAISFYKKHSFEKIADGSAIRVGKDLLSTSVMARPVTRRIEPDPRPHREAAPD